MRKGAGLGGKFWALGAASGGGTTVSAPTITGLALTTATQSTISVTFSATAGSTITTKYRAHGATSWIAANSGSSAGTSSATFVGFAAGMPYDLQITATNTAGAVSAELDNVSTSAVSSAPTLTPSNGTRIEAILSQSSVAPGGTISGNLYINGDWNNAGKTATLTPSTGTPVTVNLPGSGSAAVPFTLTAPTGVTEIVITPSNTAGYRNAPGQPLTIFTAGSGVTSTLAIGTLPGNYLRQRPFQQCVWSGAPVGWSGAGGVTFTNGWGRVHIPISGTASAVFGRLTDADSTGATDTGGGTVISNVAQVYGAVSGSKNMALMLPASDYCVYLDLAGDAAFTNPVRVPIPFFVRDVVLVITRSVEDQFMGCFPYNGPPGNLNWSTYQKVTGVGSQNSGNSGFEIYNGNSFLRCDGTQTYGANGQAYGGVGAQELGRMFFAKKGTGVSILGLTPAGGDLDSFWLEDGTPCNSAQAMMAAVDNEARYFLTQGYGWTGIYATGSAAEYQKVYQAIPNKMFALYPSLAVASIKAGPGQNGNGSAVDGIARCQGIFIRSSEAADPSIVAGETSTDFNEEYSNSAHPSYASAIRFARGAARQLLLAESTYAGGYGRGFADRFTYFGTTATMVPGSGLIKIPFTLAPGANNLVAKMFANGVTSAAGFTYTTPTAAQLAYVVSVYQGANQMYVGSSDPLVPVIGVTIDNVNKTLNISVATSTVAPLTIQLLTDFGRNATADLSVCIGLFDDRDLGDGCGIGPCARPQLDIPVN